MTAAARYDKARRAFVTMTDVAVVVIALSLLTRLVLLAPNTELSTVRTAGAGLCNIVVCVLFARLCRAAMRERTRPVWELTVATVLAVSALVLAPTADAGSALLVLTAMVALYFPWPVVVACGAAMTVGTSVYIHVVVSDKVLVFNLVSVAIQVAVACGLTRLWLFLWRMLSEALHGQEAKAALAVSEERLRFARDLHDLLGHSLSVITVKTELASKLMGRNDERAAAELAEVRRLAKDSLREVRLVVQGYRAVDLATELASVRAVLEAAGIRCEVTGDGRDLPEQTRTLLAWAIREGATNILKHSTATYCEISISGGVLEMRNDGARGPTPGTGTGLDGLAERVGAAGGTVSTTKESGRFVLRTEVPA